MRTHTRFDHLRRRAALGLALALGAAAAVVPSGALAGGGGTSFGGSGGGTNCKSGTSAKISDGKAIPPCSAPRRVKDVIAAANRIAKGKGYCYGGGHQSFKSSCYDCSGAVSYALHGGRFLDSPLDSSGFMHWGKRGRGKWITVYANPGHAFMMVAGLRFDTSNTPGAGPGWASGMGYENPRDYRKRHKGRF